MSIKELVSLVGTHRYIEPCEGLQFRVRVTDVKTSHGRPRIQVEAIEGRGSAWVAVENTTACYDPRNGQPTACAESYSDHATGGDDDAVAR